jgi:hypothetical protein
VTGASVRATPNRRSEGPFNSLRPVAVRISPPVRVAGGIESAITESAITPIPASPTTAVLPEVTASGDAIVGPADVHMGPTNVHMCAASAEVTATEVASAEVTPTKVTAASVSAAPVTASTTSKGHCRDCRTTQKDSGEGYEQRFSQH